ncbi:hypothetical protein [Bosea lathyri]|uniref:Uncharacterized protein n=1 Tax=Bosea lathyri TaxID=1036778 RepID=A0A1H6BVM1_9HYPH|nr:hypothetical protein [Bosea lathyri]SEG64713.1 hypothetical protein SAMN04488115_108119 [Bosea lathyri]
MTIITIKGVSLSANATANGFPLPKRTRLRDRIDFASSDEGHARRMERRDVRSAKRAFIYS